MSGTPKQVCLYCNTLNPASHSNCLACGAPIEKAHPAASNSTQAAKPQPAPKIDPTPRPEEQLRKIGEKTDDLYFTALNTYAIVWRTVAEALVIALGGFVLGLVGGATGMPWAGILGGLLLGISVGWVRKSFYLTLASAPVGLILGLASGAIIWAIGGSPRWLVASASLFAMIGAWIGGRPQPAYQRRNLWEKARPFLGGLGGLLTSIPGALLGWGLVAMLSQWLSV